MRYFFYDVFSVKYVINNEQCYYIDGLYNQSKSSYAHFWQFELCALLEEIFHAAHSGLDPPTLNLIYQKVIMKKNNEEKCGEKIKCVKK